MREAASDPMLLATDLAEALVRAGVPFREAHETVGRIVKHCVTKKLDLRALSREDLLAFHPAFPSAARELVNLEDALEGRALPGATARARVEAALDRADAELRAQLAILDAAGAS
jgi:argininosuccinate lyase